MQLGFLTSCFPGVPLEDLVPWAARQGFQALELAAWPRSARRGAPPCHLDAARVAGGDAERVRALFDRHGLGISALAYYDNNLHPHRGRRAARLAHLRRVIDAAERLGVGLVGTFVGARPGPPDAVMREAGAVFRGVVRYAEDRGVRVMIENCPMTHWVAFGRPGNYAYAPELWARLFDEVPSESLGLNFDPSHLVGLGIDHERAARDFAGRIFHVHAKDAELLPEGQYRYGHPGPQLAPAWPPGRWRYRVPGRGQIDWPSFLRTLRAAGYDGALSIEHEDADFEGSEARVKAGLRLGRAHLARLL